MHNSNQLQMTPKGLNLYSDLLLGLSADSLVDFHFCSSLVLFLLSLRLKGEVEESVELVGQVFG